MLREAREAREASRMMNPGECVTAGQVGKGGRGWWRGVVPLPALPDENDVTGIFISQIRMEMKCFTQTLPVGGEWAGPVGGTWK